MENHKKVIIASSSIDSDGDQFSVQSIYDVAKNLNEDIRKPVINIEHDCTILPLGRGINAEVNKGKNDIYYLYLENEYYDGKEILKLNDKEILVKLFFKDIKYPLRIFGKDRINELEIVVDPNRFNPNYSSNKFFDELKSENKIKFRQDLIMRKSEEPIPLIIYKIAPYLVFSYWGSKLLYTFLEKNIEILGNKSGEKLSEFLSLVRNSAIKFIKNIKNKKSFVVYILEFKGDILIQFVIKTYNVEELLNSFSKENIIAVEKKIANLINLFDPELIQFIYNPKSGWIFNYLIDKKGDTVGTLKAFDKTKYAMKKLKMNSIFSSFES
jgi:hypothetical protein